jgi:hypothetical protein
MGSMLGRDFARHRRASASAAEIYRRNDRWRMRCVGELDT